MMLRDKAATAPNKKKLNAFFVVPADVQQAEPEVLDTAHTYTDIDTDTDKPRKIGNDPVAQGELDNTAKVDKDVDINSYPQEATEFEKNINKHHFTNSDTQDAE